jgi:DNA end-binding protein Ku
LTGVIQREERFIMRPIWNGTISFGLVNIPVGVYSASSSEKISFNFLHEKDMGRIAYVKVCKVCGKEVSNDEIIRGYQYAKDEYVPLTPEDFQKVAIETTKTLAITDFVEQDEIDPMFYDQPYYLVPGKKAERAYALLREALERSHKVGIGKVAIREREYLAAIKPHGDALMMETMHFADELTQADDLNIPKDIKLESAEIKLAQQLIDMNASHFEPEKYEDTYREGLLELIDQKLKGTEVRARKAKAARATNVVDIMSKLKESLASAGGKRKSAAAKPAHAKPVAKASTSTKRRKRAA